MTRARIEVHQLSYCPDSPGEREEREEGKRKKALSIEALLAWAYGVERVDSVVESALGSGSSNIGMVAAVAELGAVVGGSLVSWCGELDAHPDARAVHRLVTVIGALDGGTERKALLIDGAKRRHRPGADVAFAAPRLKRVDNGYHPGWQSGTKPWCCTLRLVPSVEQMISHRAIYATWREALLLLWRQLKARPWLLARHTLDDELPPPLPAPERWWKATPQRFVLYTRTQAKTAWEKRWERQQEARRKKALDRIPQGA